jgi:hypothetical protein
VIAIEQADLEIFFGNFVARSKVRDAVNALLAARELSFIHVSGQSMLQITPEKVAVVPSSPPAERPAPAVRETRSATERRPRGLKPAKPARFTRR